MKDHETYEEAYKASVDAKLPWEVDYTQITMDELGLALGVCLIVSSITWMIFDRMFGEKGNR